MCTYLFLPSLRRVIDSESAYSQVMNQLELAEKERSSFHDEGVLCRNSDRFSLEYMVCVHTVETHRRELTVLREDLHLAKEALALMDSQHNLIREVSILKQAHAHILRLPFYSPPPSLFM